MSSCWSEEVIRGRVALRWICEVDNVRIGIDALDAHDVYGPGVEQRELDIAGWVSGAGGAAAADVGIGTGQVRDGVFRIVGEPVEALGCCAVCVRGRWALGPCWRSGRNHGRDPEERAEVARVGGRRNANRANHFSRLRRDTRTNHHVVSEPGTGGEPWTQTAFSVVVEEFEIRRAVG